ncbi:hypothetical protein J5N97_007172 [Dioscorea zingiberensis]|uniref:Uncharacterized protein n=1 Tax=Dioscorea zingiberensis TaxID=325984 RepID=A0A9D5HUA0_9LILI|nr:hypothetical protein J5N97_007172 [Dioscorea zingiberensis]
MEPDRRDYVVRIDAATVLRVTVAYDAGQLQEWINGAVNAYRHNFVGIHAEPRPFRAIHRRLQPAFRAVFVAIGRRVLVIRPPIAGDLPRIFLNFILRLDHLPTFVGMDMPRIAEWLHETRRYEMRRIIYVRELAARHTGRQELRNAGLKRIVQEILGRSLDRYVVSRRFWQNRWSSEHLAPELVTQGSIRVFMGLQVAQAIEGFIWDVDEQGNS